MSKAAVPLEIMSTHLAIVGRTGSGKTYAAKGLVERLLEANRRVIVLDPTGAWWGLRSMADDTPGFPIAVIGGEHGDVPLAEGDAGKVAEWLIGKGASAVIDLSELLLSERHRFVERFAEAVYRINKAPLHLVVDEADEFMPQNPLPECRRMLGNMDRIVRRGRIKGFRVTLITQRPAVLSKNVLTQANTLIAMKLMAPQDRKAIEAWIQGQGDETAGREVLNTLARLKRGEGWLWAPDAGLLERRTFPAIRTFDSSRAPEDGEVIEEPRAAASLDVGELRALLAADEPENSGINVAQERHSSAPDPAAIQSAYDAGFTAGYEQGYREGHFKGRNSATEQAADWLKILPEAIKAQLAERTGMGPDETPAPNIPPAHATYQDDRPKPPIRMNGHAGSPAPGPASKDGKRRILIALAQFPAGLSQQRLALLAQLIRGSGTWTKYLGALRSAGLVEGGETLRITPAGLKAVGPFEPLPTGEALRRYWADWLGGGGERRIFETLLAVYPKSMSTHQCAARSRLVLGSGTWTKYLGRLRSLKLVTGRGELRASEELFQ
jgi:hypothetical protein